MAGLGERSRRRRANDFGRAVVTHQMRKLGLQRGIAPNERVELGIANLGRVIVVVQAVVPRDLVGETLQLGGGFGVSHRAGRGIQIEQESPHVAGVPSGMRTRLKHPPSGKSRLSQ